MEKRRPHNLHVLRAVHPRSSLDDVISAIKREGSDFDPSAAERAAFEVMMVQALETDAPARPPPERGVRDVRPPSRRGYRSRPIQRRVSQAQGRPGAAMAGRLEAPVQVALLGVPLEEATLGVMHDPFVGMLIDGRYRVERCIGRGGMSRVYFGTHVATGGSVAVKLINTSLPDDPTLRRRFLGEARAMMAMQSNHIVRAFDVGELPSRQLYMVMEYLDGVDLATLLRFEGPLPWRRVAAIGLQICSALVAAHRRGIIHRDIKPHNIMRLTLDGDPDHVKLIDFGIAREVCAGSELTQRGILIGTPEYLAPELLQSGTRADERTDLYSLGITLYKLLTGFVPFSSGNPLATLRRHVEQPLIPPSQAAPQQDIPPTADALLARALAKDPAARFTSAHELACALRGVLRNEAADQPVAAVGFVELARHARDGPGPRDEPVMLAPADTIGSISGATPTEPGRGAAREVLDPWHLLRRVGGLVLFSGLFVLGTWGVMPRAEQPAVALAGTEVLTPAPKSPVGAAYQATPRVEKSIAPRPTSPTALDSEPPMSSEPTAYPVVPSVPAMPELSSDSDAPPRPPEPDFGYANARNLIEEQLQYLRTECLVHRAKKPLAKLKFRADLRASGWAVIRVFSSEKPVRTCVRDLFAFPFDPSPRGGAFEYTITTDGAIMKPVPLEPEVIR